MDGVSEVPSYIIKCRTDSTTVRKQLFELSVNPTSFISETTLCHTRADIGSANSFFVVINKGNSNHGSRERSEYRESMIITET